MSFFQIDPQGHLHQKPPLNSRLPSKDEIQEASTSIMEADLSSPIVTVVVGKGDAEKSFYLHKQSLDRYSCFFRSGLHNWFTSGQTKSFRLPDEDPKIFEEFARWMYLQRYYMHSLENAIKGYLLGERLLACGFQTHIRQHIDRYLCSTGGVDAEDLLKHAEAVYSGTSTGADELRHILAKYFAVNIGQGSNPNQPPVDAEEMVIRQARRSIVTSGNTAETPIDKKRKHSKYDAEARMKLVESGNNELISNVLGYCLAPRMGGPYFLEEAQVAEEGSTDSDLI